MADVSLEFNPRAPGTHKTDMSDYLYLLNPKLKFPKSILKDDLIELVDAEQEAARARARGRPPPATGRAMRRRSNPRDAPAVDVDTVTTTRCASVPGNLPVVTKRPRGSRRSTPVAGVIRSPSATQVGGAQARPHAHVDQVVVENPATTAGSAGTPLDAGNAPGGDAFKLVTYCKRSTSGAEESGSAVNNVQRSNVNPAALLAGLPPLKKALAVGSASAKGLDVQKKKCKRAVSPTADKAAPTAEEAPLVDKAAPTAEEAAPTAGELHSFRKQGSHPKPQNQAPSCRDLRQDNSSDEEIKRIAWGHQTSTDSCPSGSGLHPTPKIKAKGKASAQDASKTGDNPAQFQPLAINPPAAIVLGPQTSTDSRPSESGSHPTPKLKAKGKVRFPHLPFDLYSIVWDKDCGRPSGSGSHPTPKLKAKGKSHVQNPARFQPRAFDPQNIVWGTDYGRPSGSGSHPTPPTPKPKANGTAPMKDAPQATDKPRFPGLAIDPPLSGRTAFTMYLCPSQVGMYSSAVSQAITRLNVGRTFSPHDPVDPNFKPTISRLKVGDEWRYIEHGQAGRVSVAEIPTTPAAAATADSLYYWNPKDNTRHNANEEAAHLLDSSPNLIAGLPNPLAADPLPKKTSDDLLDLGWCVIDSSESNMSECDLPPPLTALKEPTSRATVKEPTPRLTVEEPTPRVKVEEPTPRPCDGAECEMPGLFPADLPSSSPINANTRYPPVKLSPGATPFKDHFADILQDALVKLRWISPSRKPSPLAQPDDPLAWLPGARLELENPSESREMASLNSFYRPKMRSEPDGPTTTASEPEGRKDTPTLTDGVNNVAFYDSTGKTPSSGFKQCKQDVPPELKSPPSEPDSPTTNASDAESQKITQLTSKANQFPIPTDEVDLATSGDAANLEVDLNQKPASAHDLISKLNSNEETSEIGDHID
ncbi:hypothetical protein PCASD_12096 [Puccinia coronata f. sp. avenae]|uniref:Uncharacterized protein n=1 Tax=Puccinia coronata f. sp. avenae TaxID=200324 RepID=A0A2N5UET7_9BASI|nr:hypothetical protein PCASD_12096 [Puccinia coronata f. sp. avenae]